MSRRAASFTQADVARAARGALEAGLAVVRIEVDNAGRIAMYLRRGRAGRLAGPTMRKQPQEGARMGVVKIPYYTVKAATAIGNRPPPCEGGRESACVRPGRSGGLGQRARRT